MITTKGKKMIRSSVKGGAAQSQHMCVTCKRNIGRAFIDGALYCYSHLPR